MSSNSNGIYLNYASNDNTIYGNTVTSNTYAIYLYDSSNNNITANNASLNSYYGIYLRSSSNNNTINGNNASSNDRYGIYLATSSKNSLTSNIASSNTYYGMYLESSNNNFLNRNEMNDNMYNFKIGGLEDAHYNNSIDTSNTVNRKPIYYVKYEKDRIYDGSTNAGYFAAVFCDNITIRDLELSDNYEGLLFWKTKNSLIRNVTAHSNTYGIFLRHSSNNIIIYNTVHSNLYGIYLMESSNNNIITNNANGNSYHSIYLQDSSNNNITGNNASFNYSNYGISLFSSHNNNITGNNASSNYYGIKLHDSSNNSIINNIESSNGRYGIYLISSSNDNLIYNNYFDNMKNAFDDSENIWNISKTKGINIVGGEWLGGNYWNDYEGVDLDGEDLGDTMVPYNSSGDVTNGGDNLPLLKPKPPVGKKIWETNISINMTEGEMKNIITNVSADVLKDIVGKIELIATLYSETGQIIYRLDPFFYVIDTNTSLTLETNKRIYKPNETIHIHGDVRNHGSEEKSYNLSIKMNGNIIFTDSFTLDPDETFRFTTNTSSDGSFTLEGVVEGAVVKDFIKVERPTIKVSLLAPDTVGFSPFNVGILMENIGNISVDLNIELNGTWNITIPAGESRFLETTMKLTKNTILALMISGDVNTTVTTEIIFGENATIEMDLQPTYLEGTVDVPYTLKNSGILDVVFTAEFSISSSDNQTILKSIFIPKGQNITDSVSFNLSRGTYLLRYVSPFENVSVIINVDSPPKFIVTSILPTEMNITSGQRVPMTFIVENIGGTEGEAIIRLQMPDFEETNKTWIRPGEKMNIGFNAIIPDDLEEMNYKGMYDINGARKDFSFFVQGAKISVDTSLNQNFYVEGDTANFTLNINNECTFNLSLYIRITLNDYEEIRPFNLTDFETLQFNVPVSFTGQKLFYGIYMDTGRSLYLNTLYIYKKENENVNVYTDKQVYHMGENVTIFIDTTQNGTIHLTAPGYRTNITIDDDTILNLTLPELRSGTYYIEYSFDNFTSSYPFDVIGYHARILECDLDKQSYFPVDSLKLSMNIVTNKNISGEIRTWIYDSKNYLIDEFQMSRNLTEGDNGIELTRDFSSDISGIFVLVYAVYAHSDLQYLASGMEYFDVLDSLPPNVTVIYPNGGETVSGMIQIVWGAIDDSDMNLETEIEYSNDNGATWSTIASVEDDGIYYWNTTTVPEGPEYLIRVNVIDDTGNFDSDRSDSTFRIDKLLPIEYPPVTIITSPSDGDIVNGTIMIKGTASDIEGSVQKVEIRIDNGSWITANGRNNWNYSCDTKEASNGEHTIFAWSYDGKYYSNITKIKVTIDNIPENQPPIAIIVTISPNPANESETIYLYGNGTDDGKIAAYEWISSIDGFLSSEQSFNLSNLSSGTHIIYFRVKDDFGVWSEPATFEIEIKKKEESNPEKMNVMVPIILTIIIFILIILFFKANLLYGPIEKRKREIGEEKDGKIIEEENREEKGDEEEKGSRKRTEEKGNEIEEEESKEEKDATDE